MAEMTRGKSVVEIRYTATIEGFSDIDTRNGGTLAPEDVQISLPVPDGWYIEDHYALDREYLIVPARDVTVLDNAPGGDSLMAVVASYSDRIENGRTKDSIYNAIESELQELRFEIDAENHDELEAGPDGIFGECIDIIASTLDLIRKEYPDMPIRELERKCADYLRLKCDKWERNYG